MAKQFNAYNAPKKNSVWLFLDEYNQAFQDQLNESKGWFVDNDSQPQFYMPSCEIWESGIAYYSVRFFRVNDEFEVTTRDYFTVERALHACKLWLRIQDCK